MPRIQQYVSPEASRGIDAGPLAEAAHRIGIAGRENADSIRSGFEQLGAGVEQFGENYGAMHEVPALAEDRINREAQSVRYANQFFNGGTDAQGNQIPGADPHDPELFQKYQAGLEKIWDGFGDNTITGIGNKTATAWRDESVNKYTTLGLADASNVAASAVHSGILNFADKASDIAYADPTQHMAMQKQLTDYVDAQIASMPWMSPAEAATVRSEYLRAGKTTIAEGAIRGIAEKGGSDAMRSAIASGQFDGLLSGEQQSTAQHYADEQTRASITAQKAADEEARRVQKQDFEAQEAALSASFVQPDGSLAVPPNAPKQIVALATHPGASPGAIRSLMDLMARLQKEAAEGKPPATDPHTYEDFRSRVTIPQGLPNALSEQEIVQARADGKLSNPDYNFFKGAVTAVSRDPNYKNAHQMLNTFLRGIKSSITKSNALMGSSNPTGDQKYLQFEQSAVSQFEEAYKQGNWKDLLNRNNPHSLWFQAVPYMTGQKESSQSLTDRVQGTVGLAPSVNAPKRNPGEIAEEYLKRTGGQ